MFGGTEGVAHVVEGVEEGDEVVAFVSGECLGGAGATSKVMRSATPASSAASCAEGQMERSVDNQNRTMWALGKACAMRIVDAPVAAADVGDAAAVFELGFHRAVAQGGDPGGDKVGLVAGAEEAFCAAEEVVVVLAPADPPAGAERLGDQVDVRDRRGGDLEAAGREERVVGAGQRERLLLSEPELLRRRVVLRIAAGRLCG